MDSGTGHVGFGWLGGGENQDDQEGTWRGGGGCGGEKREKDC